MSTSHKKSSKERRRRSPSSSSSSSNSVVSTKILKKVESKRLQALQEHKKKKELMKAFETPEEKRARRLLKKENKAKKLKQEMGWDDKHLQYSNADNPFGDSNLSTPFVWNKKIAKEGLANITCAELERRTKNSLEERKRELEKAKTRRLEKEQLDRQKEDDMRLFQKFKEDEQYGEWEKREDRFHLEQAKLRSDIRIKEGRAKPIDLLAKYINSGNEGDFIGMHEPYTYLNGLKMEDFEDLVEDIKTYREIESNVNSDYWTDLTIIVEDELQKLRKLQQSDFDTGINRREGIHQSVASDVSGVFKGKTTAQLVILQNQIDEKINGKAEGIDIGYWESLSSQLKAHMARARLMDRHQENLRQMLKILKDKESASKSLISSTDQLEKEETDENCLTEDGNYSPILLTTDEIQPGSIVLEEEEDLRRLELVREKVVSSSKNLDFRTSAEEAMFDREARKDMDTDEEQFSVETNLNDQVYLWSDKYRPRKPRYFNRIHTGFEWNKYNQTHYDEDNPPPKVVQGYKFNIFYPDLIDKNNVPQYKLSRCTENSDLMIIRFHAGPPYEDVAFKIVNREWECSNKRGFKCTFHKDVLQLWFNFKRLRYRR